MLIMLNTRGIVGLCVGLCSFQVLGLKQSTEIIFKMYKT